MSIRLYVGNLPKEPVDREALQAVFADVGQDVSTKVIKDRKTGKCRGFAFVTVPNDEVADQLIEKHNGETFMESPLKIEKALPRSKGKSEKEPREAAPTPSAGGRKRSSNNASRRNGTTKTAETGGVQPDPRWADDLAKLKEMLAAQTSNNS
ncbi:RNA-binding protein [Spirulina subsalsa FACHB-351]|uniref:RNA-binding protein n=1 Tax=Spirulina subsalsa FACHB-351 TaxID=234711 RepID=A0ABT3L275_9CYAN|nr:RNA-binding protein [Spirulina subsalsa]MCW6035617.1 RNA-binding protein [Spirulina subsalsa FACHB-351]